MPAKAVQHQLLPGALVVGLKKSINSTFGFRNISVAACSFSASEAAKVTARIRSIIEMVLWYSDPPHVEALLPPVSVPSIPV
jgi:hypothetical protein